MWNHVKSGLGSWHLMLANSSYDIFEFISRCYDRLQSKRSRFQPLISCNRTIFIILYNHPFWVFAEDSTGWVVHCQPRSTPSHQNSKQCPAPDWSPSLLTPDLQWSYATAHLREFPLPPSRNSSLTKNNNELQSAVSVLVINKTCLLYTLHKLYMRELLLISPLLKTVKHPVLQDNTTQSYTLYQVIRFLLDLYYLYCPAAFTISIICGQWPRNWAKSPNDLTWMLLVLRWLMK